MDYISIKYLQEFLAYSSPDIFFENKNKVIADLEQAFENHLSFKQEKKEFDKIQLIQFISTLNEKKLIVFDQWILESKGLKSILLNDKISLNDLNKKLEEHFLFRDFSSYISSWIGPKLLRYITVNPILNELNVASYIRVLDDETALLIQSKISVNLKLKWNYLSENNIQKQKASDFNLCVKQLFCDEQMQLINYLKKKFYAEKVTFIEKAINLFKHPQATYPFVLWLSKQLNKIELNPEHQEKVKALMHSLNQNDGLYFTPKQNKKSLSSQKIATSIFIPLTVILSLWFLIFYFQKEDQNLVSKNDSSFSQFSKKERQKLDSLIRIMERKNTLDEELIQEQSSYLHLTPIDLDLKTVSPLQNLKAESYIQACKKAYELAESGNIKNCSPYSEKQFEKLVNNSFLKLNKMNGEETLLIKNESKYQVQVLLFATEKDANVYTEFIQVGETINFKANAGQKIIFIPGNNLGKSPIPKNTEISPAYQHHFCFMDGNFSSHLFLHYLINDVEQNEIKIQLNDDEENGFYLLDLYQGLTN